MVRTPGAVEGGRMTDYKSYDAVIDELHKHFKDGFNEDTWWNSTVVLAALKDVPAAPVREAVLCKDCLYGHRYFDVRNGETDRWVECRNPDGLNRDTSEDSFCSCGWEKKR